MGAFRGLFVRKDAVRGTQPAEARKALAGMFAPASVIGARAGVLYGPGEPLKVTGTASWQYQVNAGHLVSSRSDSDGAVLFGSDGTALTPVVAAAPGSGSRWDLIYLRHQQVDAGGGETSDASLGVVSGVASGTPAKPAVPAGAVVLAEARVSAGATSTSHANVTISQVALYTAVRGAPIPVRSQAERDALEKYDGLSVRRLDTGRLETYRAGAWRWESGGLADTVLVPTFNGWVSDAEGSLAGPWRLHRSPTGLVTSQGIIRSGNTALDVNFGILPAGWWPSHWIEVQLSAQSMERVKVQLRPNGEVRHVTNTATPTFISMAFQYQAVV